MSGKIINFKTISEELAENYEYAGIKRFEKAALPARSGFYYNLCTHTLFSRQDKPLTAPYFLRKDVAMIDPFLSLADFQNDVKAVLIKPLVCIYLCRYHAQKFLYELALAVIHLATFSPSLTAEHMLYCLESAVKALTYLVYAVGEFIGQLLSLEMRIVITIGSEISSLLSYNKTPEMEQTQPEETASVPLEQLREKRCRYFDKPPLAEENQTSLRPK